MKKICFALAACLAALVSGCSKDTPDGPDNPGDVAPAASEYVGTMTVNASGTENVSENVTVEVTEESASAVTLVFRKVKFVPQMPMSLDVTVPGVKCMPEKDGTFTLSGDGIVPTALAMPYPKFTVTGLSGTLGGGSLEVSLNFGEYPTAYSGRSAADR